MTINLIISVLKPDGTPVMPTKANLDRYLFKDGQAMTIGIDKLFCSKCYKIRSSSF
jgi:hypothetical protein